MRKKISEKIHFMMCKLIKRRKKRRKNEQVKYDDFHFHVVTIKSKSCREVEIIKNLLTQATDVFWCDHSTNQTWILRINFLRGTHKNWRTLANWSTFSLILIFFAIKFSYCIRMKKRELITEEWMLLLKMKILLSKLKSFSLNFSLSCQITLQ